jgi:glutamyl-tRNA reductase
MIVATRITHKTAPVAVFEAASLGPAAVDELLRFLKQISGVRECFVLSTCNRVEVFMDAEPSAASGAIEQASALLARRAGLDDDEMSDVVVVLHERAAIVHLMTVACGLDSMVIGEAQIVSQIRHALRSAEEAGAVGHILGTLVRSALRVSKRARTETVISASGRSIVHVGLELAASSLGTLAGTSAVVIGSGRVGEIAAALVREADVVSLTVASRTESHARQLAHEQGGRAVPMDQVGRVIHTADLLITSTSAPGFILTAVEVAALMPSRQGRPLYILDLAMPRDVEPGAAQLDGVTVIGLEEIGRSIRDTSGAVDVASVRAIVEEGASKFLAWRMENGSAPLIGALHALASEVADEEVRRLHNRLPELDERGRQETSATVHRVVGKLLHTPTVRARHFSASPDGELYLLALRELFALDVAGAPK